MNKVVGYGCVASSQHSVKDDRFLTIEEIEWRKNTKVAEEFKKLHNLFLPKDSIVIDVIGGSYRRRHQLEKCLKTMSYGDSIVISSLSSLGLNNDELLQNYRRIYKAGIGLLLPDYSQKSNLSQYSTTDYSFTPISITDEEFQSLCNRINYEEIKTKRGRKTITLTEEFKKVYWLYERYLIDPVTACKNKYFNISKNTFRKLCDEYEASDKYIDDLEEQETQQKISGLPKRHGVINAQLAEIIYDVSVLHVSLTDACAMQNIPLLNDIQFHRFMLKHYCQKGGALKKAFDLRNYELIESLQPDYDNKTS